MEIVAMNMEYKIQIEGLWYQICEGQAEDVVGIKDRKLSVCERRVAA